MTGGFEPLTKGKTMSQIIVCHNKACRYRLPIHHAKSKDGQLFCSDKCAKGCSPPDKAPRVSSIDVEEQVVSKRQLTAKEYWNIILQKKPRPQMPPAGEISTMEYGIWD